MTPDAPVVYIVACEPSADALGTQLMAGLRAETQGRVRFAGIGGPRMVAAGLTSLFDPRELALLGIFEVIPAYRRVLARVRETLDSIIATNPDVLVTIDSWGFTGRIHERLTKAGSAIPRVRYVAPHVWAWRPGRAKQLARWIHHVMTLFPFEPPLFQVHGLPSTWVGHPVIESGADKGDGAAFRTRHGFATDALLLCVLPGSRRGEVKRLLPVFAEAVEILGKKHGALEVVMPTVNTVADMVRDGVAGWQVPVKVIDNTEMYDAFAASRAAIAASGTITLELALAGVPHVIAYRINQLSAVVFRWLSRQRNANLINILLGREAVPELIQEDCTPALVAAKVSPYLYGEKDAGAQRADFREALAKLNPGESPSRLAARTVLAMLRR